jgi:hypothetical protein
MSDVASLKQHLKKYETLKQEISKVIVGQDAVIEQILWWALLVSRCPRTGKDPNGKYNCQGTRLGF